MIFVYAITLVLITCYSLLIRYYFKAWKEQPELQVPGSTEFTPSTFFTIIVPARNEEKNIAACIDAILAQNYPRELFELIVVDDHSEDATAGIVNSYRDSRVRLLSLKELLPSAAINSYKKKAVESGILHARGEWIITTDADCLCDPGWLHCYAWLKEKEAPEFIAGPVKLNSKRGWLAVFQQLDFLSLQGITAASVSKGFHTMCNGANMAYSKKAFLAVDGFAGIDQLASGDDMFLMFKIAKKFPGSIRYLKTRLAIVRTDPAADLNSFLKQRIRWASKANVYSDKTVFQVLLLVYLLNILLLLILALAFFSLTQAAWAVGLLLIKTIAEWRFMRQVARFYDQSSLMVYFPFFQPVHILYTVLAGSFGQFGRYEWKGRKVR
jgi:cellulose synthase/poly-beta-1,6-N-acetylglucosamine synthase-like glycosyltransferase